MAYWLVKSEPATYSWEQMQKDGRTFWNGVRNAQASNNLKAMKTGDRAFFYHSGEERAVVGTVEIVKEYYPDPSDSSGRFGMVDVKAGAPLATPVTLAAIKADPALGDLLLVRQSRLSVMPIPAPAWKTICKMGGVAA
jgi:predicted RNA-binding protein with PUA-like domain